jgi:putative nucleotidyltransferase-like protein
MTLWAAVDDLIDRAPRLSDLRVHGLHLLAARRLRAVPPELAAEQRLNVFNTLSAQLVLERARATCDQPLVVMKGPELARRYPDAALRPLHDVDVLAADPPRAQRALIAAGFRPAGDPRRYADIHHLQPLRWKGLPLVIEVHARPKWVDGLEPPPVAELMACETLSPEQHALLVAAHSWAHAPLGRLLHLVDVAALMQDADRAATEALARRWGVERVWRATRGAAEAVLGDGRATWPLRLWAANLRTARERTVLESHLQRWIGAFWALPPDRAAGAMAAALHAELRPGRGESPRTKARRAARAWRDAFARLSDHERTLDRLGIAGHDYPLG